MDLQLVDFFWGGGEKRYISMTGSSSHGWRDQLILLWQASEEEAKKTRGGFPPSRLFVEIESTLYIAMSLFLAMLDKYILEQLRCNPQYECVFQK